MPSDKTLTLAPLLKGVVLRTETELTCTSTSYVGVLRLLLVHSETSAACACTLL